MKTRTSGAGLDMCQHYFQNWSKYKLCFHRYMLRSDMSPTSGALKVPYEVAAPRHAGTNHWLLHADGIIF